MSRKPKNDRRLAPIGLLVLGIGCIYASSAQAELTPRQVDAMLGKVQTAMDVQVAELCDDSTFLRRVSLDLIGRVPTLAEQDAFARDPDRSAQIELLLQHPGFARRQAVVWTASLVGYSRETPADAEVLRQWLEASVARGDSFRELTRELLAAEGQSALDGPVNFLVRHGEDMGVQVCRQFLGIRLDCARCHDHPFASWTQDDFAAMTRFFEPVRFEEISEGNIRVRNQPQRGGDDDLPRFLSGARPRTSQWRSELALFVTRSKPYARNFANRIWYDLMGRGLVHPPDDVHPENPAVAPRLLEALAEEARRQQFDLRRMVRLLCNTQTYQRSSVGQGGHAAELETFARRSLKPLTAEQVFDSRSVALGQAGSRSEFLRRIRDQTFDEDLLRTWTFRETTQTLLQQVTAELPAVSVGSIEEAFRRSLARQPSADDLARCEGVSPREVLEALLQTNEFVFNH